MAETATLEQLDAPAHDIDHVLVVPEDIEQDVQTRLHAARFIGACLMQDEAELHLLASTSEAVEHTDPIESLFDAIHLAAEGDREAREMVRINVATDVVERTMKVAHVMSVQLNVDEAGRIQQFGQSMESVQANSLRYASASRQMLERTKAETTNAFRIAEFHRQGKLEDYNVVVLSRAADDMSEAAMAAAGFFVDTMSTSIQVTSAQGEIITTESAFVAGKRQPQAPRHDAQTIAGVGARLGIDLTDKSATELLATPLLVHKSVMPNGVIDLVRLYDEAAGDTFFGEDKLAQNYFDYLTVCRQREERFKPIVETITDKLIAEAAEITDRVHATERLHHLSQDYMVVQAGFDDTINAKVFGPAAPCIEAARIDIARGNVQQALHQLYLGQLSAVSSSCPAAWEEAAINTQRNENGDAPTTKTVGDCEFTSKKCPVCKQPDAKTKVKNGVFYHVGKDCKS